MQILFHSQREKENEKIKTSNNWHSSPVTLAIAFPTIAALVMAQGNNNPNKLWGAPSYVLNILGKKSDYNGDPSYESTDRHTMFVPENVTEFLDLSGFSDAKIWISQDTEFAVKDP